MMPDGEQLLPVVPRLHKVVCPKLPGSHVGRLGSVSVDKHEHNNGATSPFADKHLGVFPGRNKYSLTPAESHCNGKRTSRNGCYYCRLVSDAQVLRPDRNVWARIVMCHKAHFYFLLGLDGCA